MILKRRMEISNFVLRFQLAPLISFQLKVGSQVS